MSHAFTPMQYPSLANMPVLDVLRLIRTLNVGPVTFFQLIERFGTAAKALEAVPEMSVRGGRLSALRVAEREQAEREMQAVEKFGARFIRYGEPQYPSLLHAISDPPPLITVIGHAHLWQQRDSVAMVGARNASANGCQFAQRMAKEIGEDGLTVVSGLARGIDTFVHRGALASGTVAVIAGGIDNIYPPENEALFAQIREAGAIVSEQAFGAIPFSGSFPGRNRIISGMSLGTVVVEASPKSGSLITARFAAEQGREVFAVPGSPLDPRARGCNQLIKQGAVVCENAYDVITGVAHMRNRRFEEVSEGGWRAYSPGPMPEHALEQARSVIQEKLAPVPVHVETLIAQTELPVGIVQTVLLEMELAGRVQRIPGGQVLLLANREMVE